MIVKSSWLVRNGLLLDEVMLAVSNSEAFYSFVKSLLNSSQNSIEKFRIMSLHFLQLLY